MNATGLDPKVSMYINLTLAILGVLAAGSAAETTLFGGGLTQKIVAGAGMGVSLLSAINIALHGYSASASGPMVSAPAVPPVAKVALAFFALLLASLLMMAPASAQQQRKPLSLVHVAAAPKAKPPVAAAQAPAPAIAVPAPARGSKQLTVAQAQQNPIAVIQQFALVDLQNALADATTNNDTQGMACWTAMIALVQNPAINLLPNAPGGFLLFQKARDLQAMLANLQSPTGPLAPVSTACAPLIISAENTLIQLGVIGGGVTAVVASGGTATPLLQGLLALLPIK